jgi:outer membrane lipoprotein-sorting protein
VNKWNRRVIVLSIFFYLFALNAIPAPRPTAVRDTINKIRTALNRIKPFSVKFVQQVFSDRENLEQADIEESGEIIFKNDRLLKWTYLESDYKVFLLEGDDYRFYDQDNEQLIIGKIKDRNRQWLWQLLFSDDIIRFAVWDNNRGQIHIKNDRESLDISIAINADYLPVKAVQNDPSGARMVYYFNDYRKNITVPGDAFQLKIPGDVDILREDEK